MTISTVSTSVESAAARKFAAALDDTTAARVINPATEDVIASFRIATRDEVHEAIATAKAAFKDWGATSPSKRANLLLKIAAAAEEHAEELAQLESTNCGKPINDARAEMDFAIDALRFIAGAARVSHVPAAGEYEHNSTSWVRREPLGVVGLISPWNYPLPMGIFQLAPAIAAGNTVVFKPSELTPLSILRFAAIANEFLPEGVLNIVLGDGSSGQAIVEHPDIRMVALTGDTKTGKTIAAVAAQTLKRLNLELGGKAPVLVFEDSHIEKTARDLVPYAFANSGQDCTAACRFIVADAVYDQFVDAFCSEVGKLVIGNPEDTETTTGPVISRKQLERIIGFVDRARETGATVRVGGRRADRPGWFYEPTVITEINQDSEVIQNEVFGPVVTIQRGESDDAMLEMANDVRYGLSASIWTNDLARTMRFTRELAFGTVWVNQQINMAFEMPFGGYGESGYGKHMSGAAIDEFSDFKHVMVKPSLDD